MGKPAVEIHNLLLEVIRPIAARLSSMALLPHRDFQTVCLLFLFMCVCIDSLACVFHLLLSNDEGVLVYQVCQLQFHMSAPIPIIIILFSLSGIVNLRWCIHIVVHKNGLLKYLRGHTAETTWFMLQPSLLRGWSDRFRNALKDIQS